MSFSFGETNRPESNPYPENLFLRGSSMARYHILQAPHAREIHLTYASRT